MNRSKKKSDFARCQRLRGGLFYCIEYFGLKDGVKLLPVVRLDILWLYLTSYQILTSSNEMEQTPTG